jgi:outer membrane protein insertion porin family
MPGSDLEFYKLTYRGEVFYPIRNEWILHFRTELGYGDGYGKTTELPFYEHFFAGGFGSVRGFEVNTLGPRSTPPVSTMWNSRSRRSTRTATRRRSAVRTAASSATYRTRSRASCSSRPSRTRRPPPFGGNVLVEGSAELLFPDALPEGPQPRALGLFRRRGQRVPDPVRRRSSTASNPMSVSCAIPPASA